MQQAKKERNCWQSQEKPPTLANKNGIHGRVSQTVPKRSGNHQMQQCDPEMLTSCQQTLSPNAGAKLPQIGPTTQTLKTKPRKQRQNKNNRNCTAILGEEENRKGRDSKAEKKTNENLLPLPPTKQEKMNKAKSATKTKMNWQKNKNQAVRLFHFPTFALLSSLSLSQLSITVQNGS